ncbi:MAG: hypothetical protein AAB601_00710 [Patescibacteria group bacterium]
MDIFGEFKSWVAGGWYGVFQAIRTVFILINLALVVLLIFTVKKSLEFRPRFVANPRAATKPRSLRDPEIARRWETLFAKASANPPQSYTLAIVEADKLTDEALKRLGFEGEHMADRLERLATGAMQTLDNLWRAHRLRNELVHAPDFDISEPDAREVLRVYERFLKELGVI